MGEYFIKVQAVLNILIMCIQDSFLLVGKKACCGTRQTFCMFCTCDLYQIDICCTWTLRYTYSFASHAPLYSGCDLRLERLRTNLFQLLLSLTSPYRLKAKLCRQNLNCWSFEQVFPTSSCVRYQLFMVYAYHRERPRMPHNIYIYPVMYRESGIQCLLQRCSEGTEGQPTCLQPAGEASAVPDPEIRRPGEYSNHGTCTCT